MNVLIVEDNAPLAMLWQRHLQRLGCDVRVAATEEDAIGLIDEVSFKVILMDLVLNGSSALTIADFAEFRQPDAQVIFVTNSHFFSDGSIFQHCGNARAFLPSGTSPSDLAMMVEHYAQAS